MRRFVGDKDKGRQYGEGLSVDFRGDLTRDFH
jgi:hypothetical protein